MQYHAVQCNAMQIQNCCSGKHSWSLLRWSEAPWPADLPARPAEGGVNHARQCSAHGIAVPEAIHGVSRWSAGGHRPVPTPAARADLPTWGDWIPVMERRSITGDGQIPVVSWGSSSRTGRWAPVIEKALFFSDQWQLGQPASLRHRHLESSNSPLYFL